MVRTWHALGLGALWFAAAVQAAPLDHPAVARYVAGWQQHDGDKVQSAFAPAGHYRDPNSRVPLGGAEIAAHVDEYKEVRFELVSASQSSDGLIELQWKAHWPAPLGDSAYSDTVKLAGPAIEFVESTSEAPADSGQLVSRYEAMHDSPTPERIDALFAPNFEVFGSTLPAAGLHRDTYIGFLNQLHGTVFRRKAGTRLLLTKDKRLVLQWTLMAGEKQMAAGVDYFSLDENGRIRKIVGVY